MFRIKICGIRQLADERVAGECGADAVGLNFCADSRRYLDQNARRGFEEDRSAKGPVRVGVFRNESVDVMRQLASQFHLDVIQLHGDEPPDFVVELRPLPVIRAFHSGHDCAEKIYSFLDRCSGLNGQLAAVLIDSASDGMGGGTGRLADWTIARSLRLNQVPLVLAGGLGANNVEQAIRTVRPQAVDVASGVEVQGMKDARLMARFVAAAQRGFDQVTND